MARYANEREYNILKSLDNRDITWEKALSTIKELVDENNRLVEQIKQLEILLDSLEDDRENLLYELRKHRAQEEDLKWKHM